MLTKKERAFTLFELIVVVIIIAILAALGLPQFTKNKEHAIGREAVANLKLIAAAERLYLMETTAYFPIPAGSSTTNTAINSGLRLSIPTATASKNWDYSVTSTTSPSITFTASATRTSVGSPPAPYNACKYSINNSTDNPTWTSDCP